MTLDQVIDHLGEAVTIPLTSEQVTIVGWRAGEGGEGGDQTYDVAIIRVPDEPGLNVISPELLATNRPEGEIIGEQEAEAGLGSHP